MKKVRSSKRAVKLGKSIESIVIPIYIRKLYTPKTKSTSLPSLTRCPTCALSVRTSELMNHLLQVHKNDDITTTELTVTKGAFPVKGKQSRWPVLKQSATGKEDATYGYHVIREHGRFGSHPSHDGFDDESEA